MMGHAMPDNIVVKKHVSGIESDSTELTLSIIQCLLGAAALHAPKLITKLAKVKISDSLCAFFYIFVICGTVAGEMFSLYYEVPVWDSLLHFSSGVMTGMLGGIRLSTHNPQTNIINVTTN